MICLLQNNHLLFCNRHIYKKCFDETINIIYSMWSGYLTPKESKLSKDNELLNNIASL